MQIHRETERESLLGERRSHGEDERTRKGGDEEN